MVDDKKRPTGHSRTGIQRRSGVDTRSEKLKAKVGERRSKTERRGKGTPKAPKRKKT